MVVDSTTCKAQGDEIHKEQHVHLVALLRLAVQGKGAHCLDKMEASDHSALSAMSLVNFAPRSMKMNVVISRASAFIDKFFVQIQCSMRPSSEQSGARLLLVLFIMLTPHPLTHLNLRAPSPTCRGGPRPRQTARRPPRAGREKGEGEPSHTPAPRRASADLRPKFHDQEHIAMDLVPDSINLNPRMFSCMHDESYLGRLMIIGRRTHWTTASVRMLERYILFVAIRWETRRRTKLWTL